ncbi:MAG: hypothetical protein GY795_27755 [Desulfobacterales bacterium]|nr:hypothetical protein [Desulfobacterales bacterium]
MKKSIIITATLLVLNMGLAGNIGAELLTEERNALIDLYNYTNGDNWENKEFNGWKEPLPSDDFAMPGTECAWMGITCNSEGNSTIEISMFNNQLTGTLPVSIGNFENLTLLDLGGGNQIGGTIPQEIGNLKNLTSLFLDGNQLTGPVPVELRNLTNLTDEENNFCNNYLYTSEPALCNFLNSKQYDGENGEWANWQDCQNIPPDRVKITGTVLTNDDDKIPLCAMVLINGQYMFSCEGSCAGEPGNYSLIAPLNDEGKLSIMGFCEGFAPFETTISSELGAETEFDIELFPPGNSPPMIITTDTEAATNNPGWVKISGTVTSEDGTLLCAMVLANGQHMFTCEDTGKYEMEVPLNDQGEIILYVFCDGFLPFMETLKPEIETK